MNSRQNNSDPSDPRHPISLPEIMHSTTTQRRPSHRQELSETQIPRHTIPPPASVPNLPAPWQLGRHSYYIPGTRHDQQLPTLSGQPGPGHLEGDGGEMWQNVHVQHQMNASGEQPVHNVEDNVEEELHRRLKARQVRLLSVPRA